MNASCRSLGKRAPLVFLKQMLQTAALLAGPGLILPASLLSQEVVPRTAVNVGTYTVEAPEGDDWTTEVDREKGSVKFTRGKQKLLSLLVGGAGGGTSITVFRTRRETDAPGVWLMNESQMADFYRDHQVRLQRESDRPGISSTSDVRKDTVQVDGKRYYRLAYTVTRKGYGAIEMSIVSLFSAGFFTKQGVFRLHDHGILQPRQHLGVEGLRADQSRAQEPADHRPVGGSHGAGGGAPAGVRAGRLAQGE